jgi:hypothetical protein
MKTISYVLSVLFILPLVACNHTPERKPLPVNTKPLIDVQYSFENPPGFKNEGELQFVRANVDTLISTINIEIAANDRDRALGLMYRPFMESNNGMLFLFENETMQSFWMRNTVISLDMIFVNSLREIVTIHKNTPTLTDQSFPSDAPAMFVVEVVSGYCDSLGIKVGDKIVF